MIYTPVKLILYKFDGGHHRRLCFATASSESTNLFLVAVKIVNRAGFMKLSYDLSLGQFDYYVNSQLSG